MLKGSLSSKTRYAWAMLGLGLLASVFGSLQVKQGIEQNAVRRFAFVCDQVTLKIQERLDAYALILRGGSALFAASNSVERQEWRAYVEKLQAGEDVPGAQGIGFAQVIPAAELATHIANIRSEGFPEYTIRPPGERAIYTSVVYIEPFRDRNLRHFGFDMFTEPVRRAAMEQARDTANAVLSGKVELLQKTGVEAQSGIVIYVPVYRNGATVDTLGQRRAALIGWVYSPCRMNDLMTSILRDWISHEGKTVDLNIYDGLQATSASQLFDSIPPHSPDLHSLFYKPRTIDFNGHQWLLMFYNSSTLSVIDYAPAWLVLSGGLALSGLLFGLMLSRVHTRANAVRIAEGLTEEFRHNQELLKESEEKLQLLLDSAAEAIYGIDMNGNCTFCNNACLRLLRYKHSDELLGKNIHRQIHSKHPDGTLFPIEECHIFNAFKEGVETHADDEVLWRSDGTSFPAEFWSYPQSRDGVITGAVVSFFDISERKRVEEELRISTQKYQTLFENSRDAFMLLEPPSWRFAGANPATLQLFGAPSLVEFTALEPWDLSPERQPDGRLSSEKAQEMIATALREGSHFFEWEHQRLDGQTFSAEVLLTRMEEEGRQFLHASVRDITERKQAEEKLLKLSTAVEQSPVSIVITDITGAIEYVNPKFTEITGYTFAEVMGQNPRVLKSGECPLEAYKELWNTILSGEVWRGEFLNKKKNGELFWEQASISPIKDNRGVIASFVAVKEDITGYKRIQEELLRHRDHLQELVEEQTIELRQSEERYRLLIDGVKDCANLMLDENGCIMTWNQGIEQLKGYTADDIIGRHFSIFYPPDAVAAGKPEAKLAQAREQGRAEDDGWRVRKDGSRFWAQVVITALYNDKGEIQGFSKITRDITERKQAEDQLDRFFMLSLDMLCIAGADGYFKRVNPAFTQTLGWSTEEFLARPFLDFVHPDDHAATLSEVEKQVAAGENVLNFENRYLHKDGSWRVLSWASVPHASGLMFATARDVTMRNQAEEEVRQLNAELSRFKDTLDQTLDCVFMFRPDTLLFTYVNEGAKRHVGYSETELMQMTPLDIKPEFNLEQFRQKVLPLIEGALPSLTFHTVHRHKDGHDIPVEICLQFIHLEGQEPCFVAVVRDITERKLFEQALVAAKTEADQANRTKSDFLAAMSHEIRTPMNGVIGMIDVLSQSSLQGYQVEMVDLIRESAYSLLDIIEDILDFSKIEAGKLELESAPMQVADAVEKACAMLDFLAAKKRVELTLFTDPAIPAEVLGDAERLHQILINLANNAIKFSSGQERAGRVSVRAVLAKRSSDRAVVEIQIADNGIGMDEETLSRLFIPFTQADASTTRRFGGTGLGLVITRHLVELMSGEITVQSFPGRGSTFTLRLPFAPLPAKTDAGKVESPVSGLSCLLVGNSEWLADDIAAYLAHGGATVVRVPDLAAAREQGERGLPGIWVWILDNEGVPLPQDELHAIARTRPQQQNRLVVFERGQRREPRLEDVDIVKVDANMLSRKTVLKTVAIAAGRTQAETGTALPHAKTKTDFSPPSRAAALLQGRLILVAEDNITNQKVILHQLALLGFAADLAGDGRQALKNWQSGDYALLLTDLHMPEMDGYELTKAIRAAEDGSRDIRIIALTANALKGEAEYCRGIGMDDYLTKPVQLTHLKAILEKWLPVVAGPGPDSERASCSFPLRGGSAVQNGCPAVLSPDSLAIPVDVSVLKALVGDIPEVISDFLQDYRNSATQIAAELKGACTNGQAAQVGALAHKLKSSARSVGALKLGELCAEIEQAGKAGQIEALAALLPRFEAEIAAVDEYLDTL